MTNNTNNQINKATETVQKKVDSVKPFAKKTSNPLKVKRDKRSIMPKFESNFGDENETVNIPPLAPDAIRIINLGGVEEIGRNMSMIEYKDTIILIDCGVQFSESTTPGIEFILPNTKYIEERKHKIKGMVITHGHLDHIGSIPYIMPRIGNPTIYARNFTSLMIRKRHEEFPYLEPLKLNIVEKGGRVQLGDLAVNFFGVSHAIPDSMGIIIETPFGDIVHTGDVRLDHENGIPSEREIKQYSVFKERKILCLLTDSTNCENPGFSISDSVVYKNIEEVIKNAPGRLIISTFSSQVERMLFMLDMCEKYGKKVTVEGRSMKTNIEVTKLAGMLKIKEDTLISIDELTNYPQNKIVILATGAQGEEFAALGRIGRRNHKYIKLTKFDTILMSSSVVPGNENNVQRLKDDLSRQGAHLISYKTSDVHSSGHANADELAWIHKSINPKFFIPVHGYHYMLTTHSDIAMECGTKKENIIVPDNGMIIEIRNSGKEIVALKEKAPSDLMVVDGNQVGKVEQVVLNDRQKLGEDGIFAIIAVIDSHSHRLKKSPDIASRGFVYLRESQDMLHEVRYIIKQSIDEYLARNNKIDKNVLKDMINGMVEKELYERTSKRPVVSTVIITI